MKVVEDYKYWIERKRELLDNMREDESLIYDRIEPIILTLQHLETKEELDEDETYIFNVGFMYLYEQIEAIETYIASEFKTFDKLDENSIVYNLLCEIEDFKSDFIKMGSEEKEVVQEYIDRVESLLFSREQIANKLYETIESTLMSIVDEYGEYLPVSQIFKEIAENYELI